MPGLGQPGVPVVQPGIKRGLHPGVADRSLCLETEARPARYHDSSNATKQLMRWRGPVRA
jgi:hypothetical protein